MGRDRATYPVGAVVLSNQQKESKVTPTYMAYGTTLRLPVLRELIATTKHYEIFSAPEFVEVSLEREYAVIETAQSIC